MKKLVYFLLAFMFIFGSYTAYASPEESSVEAADELCLKFDSSNEIESKSDVKVDKAFCIKFDLDIDSSSVNENSVYILGYKNKKISTKLSVDGKKIIITPVKNYEAGEKYFLVLENIKATKGNTLKEKVYIEFNIKEDENVIVHDISNVNVYTYESRYEKFDMRKVGSCENILIKRPENSTLEQDIYLFNTQMGNGSYVLNDCGQITYNALKHDYVRDVSFLFTVRRDENNRPVIMAKRWAATKVDERASVFDAGCMSFTMEFLKYYARTPQEGKAIWSNVDDVWKHKAKANTSKIHKFGQTKVKFEVPSDGYGVKIIFLNAN